MVKFQPRNYVNQGRPFFSKSFSVTNAYLHSTCNKTKLKQLQAFALYRDTCAYSFAGGDWNVKLLPSDSVSGNVSSSTICKAFKEAMSRRRLLEVWHPAMTKISNHRSPQVSRLDRWFSSHSPGERQVMEPRIWLPSHPHEPGLGSRSPSDHFPVHLSFHSTKRYAGWRKIPEWLTKLPSFGRAVEANWAKMDHGRTSSEELWNFNACLQSTSRELLQARRVRLEDKANAIALAVTTFTKLLGHKISVEEAYERLYLNSVLAEEISPDLDRESLIESIQNYLWSGSEGPARPDLYTEARSAYSSKARSYEPRQPRTKADYNQRIKKAHCDSRSGLSFLIDDKGDRVTKPKEMARLLKDAWEPVWRGSPAPRKDVISYLRSYKKKVRGIDTQVSLADVINEILVKRKSCAGPNGIPFACYAAVCDLFAPILLRFVHYLMSGGAPKADFNASVMFFLPKDGSGLPSHNRPIAASNTDNRLVANIVRRKLESSCHAIIDPGQIGFVKGKMIDFNVNLYNRKFYTALYSRYRKDLPAPGSAYDDSLRNLPGDGPGHDYNVMFLDFAKAYDSVSRDFLFLVLEWIGVPRGYITLIRALYHSVYTIPALHGKTSCRIRMLDGLKQGCPLSCLLFILAMDPLVTLLGRLPRVDPAAFADDAAVGARDPADIIPALLLVDAWSKVSRVCTNYSKTKIISTSAAPVMFTHLAPPHWRCLKYTDSYVYLGVLIGRSVDVTDVFEAAVEKFERRVSSFMSMQDRHTMAGRVRLANMYLLPIFSYLFRFFLMSAETSDRVLDGLGHWLIKGNCTNLKRLSAPTHLLGLANPLHDLSKLNVAAILRRRKEAPVPHVSGAYSMLVDDHIGHAAEYYHDLTGLGVQADADQSELMANMVHSDVKPLERLVSTLAARYKRHGRRVEAKVMLRSIASNALRMPTKLRSAIRNHMFNIVHQCVFTNDRARAFGQMSGCMFCGHEREDFQHLFIDCVVAKDAIRAMSVHQKPLFRKAASFLGAAPLADFLLETENMEVMHMRVALCFSLAIWKTRRFYRVAIGAPSLRSAASRVLLEMSPLLYNWQGGGRRDKEAERRSFLAAVSILPTPATFVYTDGSSFGNPGPSGAGFAVSSDNAIFSHLSARSLGHGTNNAAELEAIRDATSFLAREGGSDPTYIFTDNRLAMRVAMGRVTPDWAAQLSRAIQANIIALAAHRKVYFLWVPGHADVAGNDVADRLAKLGSSGVSGSWDSLTELPTQPGPHDAAELDVKSTRGSGCSMCADVIGRACARAGPVKPASRRAKRKLDRPNRSRYNLRSHRQRHCPDCEWGYESDLDWEPSDPDLGESGGVLAPSPQCSPRLRGQGVMSVAPPPDVSPLAGPRGPRGEIETESPQSVSSEASPRPADAPTAFSLARPDARSVSGLSLCPGSSVGPVRPEAVAMMSSAPSAPSCERVPHYLPPSSGEEVSAPVASARSLPATSLASDGMEDTATAPSPPGRISLVGPDSRGRVEAESPQFASSEAGSGPVANAMIHSRGGQLSPLSLRSGGENVSVVGEPTALHGSGTGANPGMFVAVAPAFWASLSPERRQLPSPALSTRREGDFVVAASCAPPGDAQRAPSLPAGTGPDLCPGPSAAPARTVAEATPCSTSLSPGGGQLPTPALPSRREGDFAVAASCALGDAQRAPSVLAGTGPACCSGPSATPDTTPRSASLSPGCGQLPPPTLPSSREGDFAVAASCAPLGDAQRAPSLPAVTGPVFCPGPFVAPARTAADATPCLASLSPGRGQLPSPALPSRREGDFAVAASCAPLGDAQRAPSLTAGAGPVFCPGPSAAPARTVADAAPFSASPPPGRGQLPPPALPSRREGEFAVAASCAPLGDARRAPSDTLSAGTGPTRGAKRLGLPIVPAARPGKRLRQESLRQFLSHTTHVVQTSSSNSMELRPIRQNRKRKRTNLINSSSLADPEVYVYRRSAVKLKRPRTTKAREDTDTNMSQTVLRRDSEPPKGTDCLGANFPT